MRLGVGDCRGKFPRARPTAAGRGPPGPSPLIALTLVMAATSIFSVGTSAGAQTVSAPGVPASPVDPTPASAGGAGGDAAKAAADAGIDIGSVIETVSHHVGAGPNEKSLAAEDLLYKARFDDSGFDLTLRRPGAPEKETAAQDRPGLTWPERKKSGPGPDLPPFEPDPEFGITLSTVQAGPETRPAERSLWKGHLNVASRSVGKGLTERVTALNGRLKWDFVVEERPAGRGDMTINAKVSSGGLPKVVAEAANQGASDLPAPALRWPLDGGRAIRVGEMVVIDAGGKEVHRALPSSTAGGLGLTVPSKVLEDAAYPLTIDPIISPEYPVSKVEASASAGTEFNPAIASNGSLFLVVWEDIRSYSVNPYVFGGDIYATRVKPDGELLDPVGIPISKAPHTQLEPAVASNGFDFFVTWTDCRGSVVYRYCGPGAPQWPNEVDADIYGTRVAGAPGLDGKSMVLDPGGVLITASTKDDFSPALAWEDDDYFVAWATADCNQGCVETDVEGKRVPAGGGVLDEDSILISNPRSQNGPGSKEAGGVSVSMTLEESAPAVASKDGQAFVVWHGRTKVRAESGEGSVTPVRWDIYGLLLDDGKAADPVPTLISSTPGDQMFPSVAWNGTEFMVVWEDWRDVTGALGGDIAGAMVDPSGLVADERRPGNLTPYLGDQTRPEVASNGSGFVAVWEDWYGYLRTEAAVFDGALNKTTLDRPETERQEFEPKVAYHGNQLLVLWSQGHCQPYLGCTDWDVAGFTMSVGTHDPPARVAMPQTADSQWSPSVAWDPVNSNYLVVWADWNGDWEADIHAARLKGSTGQILDARPIHVSEAMGPQWFPSVAWNGSQFLVAWDDGRSGDVDIYAAALTPAGVVGAPFPVSSNPQRLEVLPSVASANGTFLVTWTDMDWGFTDVRARAARVKPAAVSPVLDPAGIDLTGGPASPDATVLDYFPRATGAGDSFLVAWTTIRNAPDSWDEDVYAAKIKENDGTVSVVPVSTAFLPEFSPAVAWSGSVFLVVWRDCRAFKNNCDVYGARLSPALSVTDRSGIAISTGPGASGFPAVGWNGVNFVAAWNDCGPEPMLCSTTDVHAVRMSPTGSVLDRPIPISASQDVDHGVNITAGPWGEAGIVYQRVALEYPYGAPRVFLKRFQESLAASFTTPATLSGTAVATFTQPVKNVSGSNIVLRVAGTTTNLSNTIRCLSSSSAAVSCSSGPVASAHLSPSATLVPGQRYSLLLNPNGAVPIVGTNGILVKPTAQDFRASTIEEQDSLAAKYRWRTSVHLSAHGGSYTVERSAGATATFGFSGSSVTWYTIKGPNQGLADVRIDGVFKGTVNLYASSTSYKEPLTFSGLSAGSHTISIKVRGLKGDKLATDTLVSVDAFQAGTGALVATPEVSYRFATVRPTQPAGVAFVQSDITGSSLASFVFRGTGVDWVTVTGPKMGRADVYIDGVKKLPAVDNYSASLLYGQVRSVTGLPDGLHTLRIVALGTRQKASGGTFVAHDKFLIR